MLMNRRWLLVPLAFVVGCSVANAGFLKRPFQQEKISQEKVQLKSATTQDETTIVDANAQLLKPEEANEVAPDSYKVKVETTQGSFVIEVTRDWAPNGADRFYNLVKRGYFNEIAIFRAIDGFMFQFGIHGDAKLNKIWSEAKIKDDPNTEHANVAGTITFATSGPNSRTVQLFVNLGDNSRLDEMGFTPFGKVIEDVAVLGKINMEYGENSSEVQGRFQAEGNTYIKKRYPNLDYIKSISFVEEQK